MKTLLIICLSISIQAQQKIDSVYQNKNILIAEQIPFGKSTYLVYMKDENRERSFFSIWERNLNPTNNGNYIFEWTMKMSDIGSDGKVQTELGPDFLPIKETAFYSKKLMRKNNDSRKAFTFYKDKMVSSNDTTKHNSEPIVQTYTTIPFNWQLDMETYSQLPLELNRSFLINFYHPGSSEPKFHRYDVIGEEEILSLGKKRKCWILKARYSENSESKWYIDQLTFRVLKLEERFGNRYRFKILIDNLDDAI